MLDAVTAGASDDVIEGVEVVVRPALTCPEVDVLEADGYVLGTTANIGYMSGALKHFFDRIYYPCLGETAARPFGFWVHGNSDTTGAVRALETVTTGLEWRTVHEPVTVIGEVGGDDRDALYDLGGTVAASLVMDL
jgi:multimeric flavodoxin WrbA